MKTAFGLDLAGYSGGRSTLAKATFAEQDGFRITIYRNHAFATKLEGHDAISEHAEQERHLIQTCRPLYIDVPIELQGLPALDPVHFVWQLTKRPVDYAFGGLPPLADRIGSPVARIVHLLQGDLSSLGTDLFETYPAASLLPMLGVVPSSYKGRTAERQGGRWIGDDGLADILTRMRIEAVEGTRLNDDHLDAAICAITGILVDDWLLQGKELEDKIRHRLKSKMKGKVSSQALELLDEIDTTPPKGYVLIQRKLSDLPLRLQFEDNL